MNAPTLLIGLGGCGGKIVERVARLVTSQQRDNIAFVVFDTDINELSDIQKRNPFIRTIQTSTRQTVGEYLNKDVHARDSWFPVNAILNGKTLSEGAGQVRSISRLALETVIRAGKMEPLHEAIQSLYKVEEDKVDQALRVIIVGSLAGGTGSGLILPVALYTRNYLESHFRQSANITRGFFVLPEVFYEVIPGTTERNNLKANAYATLRELDAFLMKKDATLPERYADSVRMQFPRAASEGYEEYDVRPFDFCFLFDAQNAEGGKLNSHEQYLDHAANCIYAQSIGPMNKRSNSSEDNTIRKLVKARGRNRYAGAGASMLIYPFEDIRTLIALSWAKQCVSKRWMVFDDLYRESCEENARRRESGIAVQEQDRASFYVNQIDSAAKHEDPFAKAIFKSTGSYNNGVTRISDRWKEYVGAVMAKIEADLQTKPSTLDSKRDDARMLVNTLDIKWEDYPEAFAAAQEYRLMATSYVQEVSQTIAYSLFKRSKSSQTDSRQKYVLENCLVGTDNQFLHPNAIRYMLIKILELMKKKKESVNNDLTATKAAMDKIEAEAFDNKETEETETADDVTEKSTSFVSQITKRPSGEQEDIKKRLKSYVNKVDEYQIQYVQLSVLDRGIDYISSIIKAFEGFYSSLDSKVELLDRGISEIYRKYSSGKGATVRYVCADKMCFDKILAKKTFMGSSLAIDSDLAQEIYEKILAYSTLEQKPNNNRYFSELFDKSIIGYFENSVMKEHGSTLDVDVITAIENEAELEGRFEDDDNAYALIDQYVRKVINDTRKLSCPFIESPMGVERESIDSCTFNIGMKPDKGDESPRAQLIRKELMNHGGAPDEDISKNMIMFYQSFYGLRANDLSKFAPPEKTLTYNRPSGEYFKAYYELVSGIHPEPHRSREISPHIDRWWHIITKMPDLDDGYQAKQEYDIYSAFFWAVINRYVWMPDDDTGGRAYKLKTVALKLEDDTLMVSNGTACDKFYEILDAIAIYPELVSKILSKVEAMTGEDVNSNTPLEEGVLLTALRDLSIEEPGIGAEKLPSNSIFDIPLLMRKSSNPENYYEPAVVEMLRVELEEVKKYLACFCSQKELPGVFGGIVMEQFEKHLADVTLESGIHASICRESLFDKCCDTIENMLREMGLRKEADTVKQKVESLRR